MKKSLIVAIAIICLAGCNVGTAPTPDASEAQDVRAEPAVPTEADALRNSPSAPANEPMEIEPMESGSFLMSTLTFPAIEDLSPPFYETMYNPDPQGATDAAYFYLVLASRAYSASADDVADLTYIHALATDDCSWCRSHEQLVSDLVSQNLRVTGWDLAESANYTLERYETDSGSIVCSIPLYASATHVWDPAGTLVLEEPAREDWYNLEMVFVDGLWRVNGISVEPVA